MRSSAQRVKTARPEARRGADTSGSASRRHRGRVWLGRVLLLAAVLGASALLLMIQVEAVRDDLERGRSEMERGRDRLLAGDATGATESFEQGGDSFAAAAAAAGSRSWILGGVAWIPVAGRTVDVLTPHMPRFMSAWMLGVSASKSRNRSWGVTQSSPMTATRGVSVMSSSSWVGQGTRAPSGARRRSCYQPRGRDLR